MPCWVGARIEVENRRGATHNEVETEQEVNVMRVGCRDRGGGQKYDWDLCEHMNELQGPIEFNFLPWSRRHRTEIAQNWQRTGTPPK